MSVQIGGVGGSRFRTKFSKSVSDPFATGRSLRKKARLRPRTKNAVRSIVRTELNKDAEHKFVDIKFLNNTIDWAGSLSDLCQIAQSAGNSTDTTRIGDSVMPTSLEMRLTISFNSTSIYNVMRLIIFRWETMDSTHGIAPTAASILQNVGTDAASVNSMLNHDRREQFVRIYDKTFTMDDAKQQIVSVKYRKILAKKAIKFYVGTQEGQYKYYLLAISNVGTNLPQVQGGYIRLNFTDN